VGFIEGDTEIGHDNKKCIKTITIIMKKAQQQQHQQQHQQQQHKI
jgi:hypothetical protein